MKKGGHKFERLVMSRKTCYEFTDNSISEKDIQKILQAGQWAPSFSNSQPWRFQVISNKKVIDSLVRTSTYGGFHISPPLLIAIILPHFLVGGEHRGMIDKKVGLIDANLSAATAAQNMVLQATDLLISSAILTPNQEKARKILGLKSEDHIPFLISLGYENKKAFQKKRERLPLDHILLKRIN